MSNPLYPIFLKVHQLQVLIVGGGEVALEKLSFMLKSSPEANITLVAPQIREEIRALAGQHQSVQLIQRPYQSDDLNAKDMVIAATDQYELHLEIRAAARARNLLVNVADTPALCDFYLGAIVSRGDLKVAISTNGQSPTFAKRFRQWLEAILPEETHELLQNLRGIRDQLGGDFQHKVKALNDLTAELLSSASPSQK